MSEDVIGPSRSFAAFEEAIIDLRKRSLRARVSFLMVAGGMAMSIVFIVTWIVANTSLLRARTSEINFNNDPSSLEHELNNAGSDLVRRLLADDLSPEKRKELERELERNVELLKALPTQQPIIERSKGIADYVPAFAFSIGGVGFVVLLIQIAVQFLRYFARLSELYAAQATAMIASAGDVQNAILFMQNFSPASIDIGKAPSTIYEKALDTIAAVAKKND
ncbi:MAG TPA: hypothetical protein VHE37_12000 [Nevskiaceae bacterium]|nr:hypothetical protein [Nevskiaceae bacterium]